jgi:hypothetical protein
MPEVELTVKGTMHATPLAKSLVARSMFRKGEGFIAAAELLSARNHHGDEAFEWVALHLWCQGIEVALKGLLLLNDYDGNRPKLRKIRHDLAAAADATLAAYGLNAMGVALDAELRALSNLYSLHLLRYGSNYDVLVRPQTVARERVRRRMFACFRLVHRELAKVYPPRANPGA